MEWVTGEGDEAVMSIYPMRCQHCEYPVCVEVCPTGANQQSENGIVWIDQNKCVGCRYCVVSCPYQARTFNTGNKENFPGRGLTGFEKAGKRLYPHQAGTAEKCNFCKERIEAGLARGLKPGTDREATPACVNTCPARVMTFGDLDDPCSKVSELIGEKEGVQLHTEYGTNPSIYYIDSKIGAGYMEILELIGLEEEFGLVYRYSSVPSTNDVGEKTGVTR